MTHPHAEILQAIANGRGVQHFTGKEWQTITTFNDFLAEALLNARNHQFRIKPITVTINGVELEDDRVSLGGIKDLVEYFIESMSDEELCALITYDGYEYDVRAIQRGIAHHTREGAIAFCKARLGIKD